MTLSFTLLAILGCLLLIVRALLTALVEYSRSRLEKYCQSRNRARMGEIFEHDEPTASALRAWSWLLAVAFTSTFVLWMVGAEESPRNDSVSLRIGILATAAVGGAAIIADLWLARPLGKALAAPLLYWSWPVLTVLRIAAYPFLAGEKVAHRLWPIVFGQDDESGSSPIQEELLSVVNEGEREGTIHEDAADMIEGLIELHESAVSEVMTPRTDMVMLRGTASLEEACRIIVEHGHSRIPVYGETRDEIVGMLYAKDLLPHIGSPDGASRELSTLELRTPLYVPETKPVHELLREFQRGRVHIAIVLDEYGGVAGLVTIEDILEEIVGEITDEHDPLELAPIQKLSENAIEVDGRVHVDELNEVLPLRLPEDADYDTVGGFVFSFLGRIPRAGESFLHDEATFTIVDAGDRAIRRIRIEMAAKGDEMNTPSQAG